MGWWHRAAALALFALFLMPINYRAGAATPHGHALVQLIYEVREGIPVHHHGVDEVDRHNRSGDISTSHAGAPPIQVKVSSALLPMILLALALQKLRSSIRLASDVSPASRSLRPEPPPPRSLTACTRSSLRDIPPTVVLAVDDGGNPICTGCSDSLRASALP